MMIDKRAERTIGAVSFYILASIAAIIMLIPFFWMIITSLKGKGALFTIPIEWIPKEPTLAAYTKVINLKNFNTSILNSLYLAVTTSFLQVLSASMAAYAFSKIRFKGRESILRLYLATMMIPFNVIFIPLFIIMVNLRLTNSLNAFLLLQFFNPFAIFMLRQKMMTISDSFVEAALIDGASQFQIFRKIIVPLSSGIIATLYVLSFMGSWNDYLMPLVMLSDKKKFTLPLALQALRTQYGGQENMIMAGALISILPMLIIYAFAQKYFQTGLQVGGVKG